LEGEFVETVNGESAVDTAAILSARGEQGWRFTPHVIIFFSSACVMIVELVAGRLAARHLGSSLYTWTSIIGVVLAGMSIGNYFGGRMADRWKAETYLGWLFLIASGSCLLTLLLNQYFEGSPLRNFAWPIRVFTTVTAIFILPALALGTFSPAIAKMALDRGKNVGATIGTVYAWGAAGSILGTLSAGFWLIALLGAKGVIILVSFVLAIIGLWIGPQRLLQMLWVLTLIGVFILSRAREQTWRDYSHRLGLSDAPTDHFSCDSCYQFIRVYDVDSSAHNGVNLRCLTLDFLIHGYVKVGDPNHLEYDYERVYRDVANRYTMKKMSPSAFFIGGGSYTFPRWVLHQWPKASVDVAEIDPMVLEANHAALGLPRDTPIQTMIGDARNVIDDLPPDKQYDLIFGDAFNDLSVPFHLTTLEFAEKLNRHLTPDGAYLLNVIDCYDSGLLLGSMVNTLRKVFRHVYVFCTQKDGVKEGRDTFVIAASNIPLKTHDWRVGHQTEFFGSLLTGENIATLQRRSGGRIITDDDAPVENLLEPVLRMRE
jgi:spermidine synthase/MFS family permease